MNTINIKIPQKILKEIWGYDKFRIPQEEIIQSILKKKNVIALLPTGAGKSICFQVPAMIMNGICIVISPLLALMKDQVERLNSLGINAVSVSSSLSKQKIDDILDNCIYGNIKFLYIAPERINSTLFIERFKKMNVSFLTIDEAHCISQWGYEFRPSYLNIVELKQYKPNLQITAFTASATKEVRKDIINKLEFKAFSEFTANFERHNLSYNILELENKKHKLLDLLKKNNASVIIYTSTRKSTKELSDFLQFHKIPCLIYHGGLDHKSRESIQSSWLTEKIKIIIATKAFGMGIDKPNVRKIIHYSPPMMLEDYIQETGRAGRDGLESRIITLYSNADYLNLKRLLEIQHPDLEFIVYIYQQICNFLNIPYNAGKNENYEFNINIFIDKYKLNYSQVYSVIKILERENVLAYIYKENINEDKLMIKISPNELLNYRKNHPYNDKVIEVFLRMYGGDLFYEYGSISIEKISKRAELDILSVIDILLYLNKLDIISFKSKKQAPSLTFKYNRFKNLIINVKMYKNRKKLAFKRLEEMFSFLRKDIRCRQQILIEFLGDISYYKCNKCDNCTKLKSVIN